MAEPFEATPEELARSRESMARAKEKYEAAHPADQDAPPDPKPDQTPGAALGESVDKFITEPKGQVAATPAEIWPAGKPAAAPPQQAQQQPPQRPQAPASWGSAEEMPFTSSGPEIWGMAPPSMGGKTGQGGGGSDMSQVLAQILKELEKQTALLSNQKQGSGTSWGE